MSMTSVRSGEYRKQAQQQNFLKRIHHLAALSAIWQIFEIIQKTIASQNAPILSPPAPLGCGTVK